MKKTAKIMAFILSVAVLCTSFAGCGGTKTNGGDGDSLDAKYGSAYPIEADETLTYWMPLTANISTSAANYGELPVAKSLEERTGIKVEYIHPSLTNAEEKFNLMVASGDLADIIEYFWGYYPGGPEAAIKDGVIQPLNDLIDAYAPNHKKILEENEMVAREARTDGGYYFSAGVVAVEPKLNTSGGLIIRQDWLDELGLEMPETIPEWYNVLKAFKDKKGATAPLSVDASAAGNGAFVGAFGVTYDFYLEDGKVVYGPMQPGFKEYLKTMNQWYNEGLFDNNFATTDSATRTANMLNGVTAVIYGGLGGNMGALISAAQEPGYKLAGAPYPTHEKGATPKFGQSTPPFTPRATISSTCKSPELAMKLLDYGYSEEGALFMNFGDEGVSYEMVDGYPTYTDLITKNPDGLSMSQALTKYSKAGQAGPLRQDLRYLEQYAGKPEQQEAWNNWINTDAKKYILPTTYISEENSNEYATKMTDVKTYVNEMYIKFISGIEPIDNFDTVYMDALKSMGIEDLVKMEQEAYENYMNR